MRGKIVAVPFETDAPLQRVGGSGGSLGQSNLFAGGLEPVPSTSAPRPEEAWLCDPDFGLALPEAVREQVTGDRLLGGQVTGENPKSNTQNFRASQVMAPT
jgi:hypothetical protein